MVHKKHQSKRISTSRREKNHKNAMEKQRKARKAARLNPQSKKIKKDPGVPNLWPFKEKILQEIEAAKNKAPEPVNLHKMVDREVETNPSLIRLKQDIDRRTAAFASIKMEEEDFFTPKDPALAGNRDNSKKAYFKEFKKVLEAADVLLEVLDARDPLGCRTRNIERMILNDPNKRVVLILNKIDLIPTEVADSWIKYFRKELPTIGFKSSTQNQRTNIGHTKVHVKNASSDTLAKSSTLGADSLIKLLKNYSRSQNLKTSLTVGVIGYPNVGKSSLINSLKRSKVCGVGARPGFTKVAQEIHLDAKLKLLDCPGIVFGGFDATSKKINYGDVLLRNCIKVELIEDPISAVDYLLKKTKWHHIMMQYDLPAFSDVKGFLVELCRKRCFIKKNGIPDLEGAARLVLRDWNSGNIPYYTLPPKEKVNSVIASEVLSTWGQEFNLEDYDSTFVLEPKAAALPKSMVLEESMEPTEGEDDFLKQIAEADNGMEDELPELVIADPKPVKEAHSVPEKRVSFEEGLQVNKDMKAQFKKDKKRNAKAQKENLDMLEFISDQAAGGSPTEEYDFKVLESNPMED